jgi:hypothetical protein
MDVTAERHFFLQSIDPASGFAVSEVYCGTSSINAVAKQIEEDVREFDAGNVHILDESSLARAKKAFSVELEVGDNEACLCSWSQADGLPYRLHSNRELILMQSGRKPLTVLSGRIPPSEYFEEIPEYLFDPLVESGLLVKTQFCEPNPARHPLYKGLRHVLYALRQQEWRLDAYIMLRNVARKAGWNEALTRFEGSLLGYTEWENNAYATFVREHAKPVTASDSK